MEASVANPKLSVLLPVYNAADYLKQAVDSLLAQTFTDFEIIAIDDGSTDDSLKVLKSYDDPRLKITSRQNKRLIATLNEALGLARGEYVARMDADDESLPRRFERQVEFLNSHPNVVLVGSDFDVIDEQNRLIEVQSVMTADADIRRELFVKNAFGHGTIMARRAAIEKAGGFRADYLHVEDYDLWRRMLELGGAANLPESLYRWRVNTAGVSLSHNADQTDRTLDLMKQIWQQSDFPNYSLVQTIKAAGFYRSLDAKGGRHLNQFVYDQYALAIIFYKQGKPAQAIKLALGGFLSAPAKIKYLLVLMFQNRTTHGFNLNLVLKPPVRYQRLKRQAKKILRRN